MDDISETVTLVTATNHANNREATADEAFWQLGRTEKARYHQSTYDVSAQNNQQEYNGIDTDGDGVLDAGRDFDGDGIPDRIATGNELLARHLYCLMFALIADPAATPWVADFPYPNGLVDNTLQNRYVARRLAQWAANAVDYRDTDVAFTRLRYDPNPFDGFDLAVAQRNVVWGMGKARNRNQRNAGDPRQTAETESDQGTGSNGCNRNLGR